MKSENISLLLMSSGYSYTSTKFKPDWVTLGQIGFLVKRLKGKSDIFDVSFQPVLYLIEKSGM